VFAGMQLASDQYAVGKTVEVRLVSEGSLAEQLCPALLQCTQSQCQTCPFVSW